MSSLHIKPIPSAEIDEATSADSKSSEKTKSSESESAEKSAPVTSADSSDSASDNSVKDSTTDSTKSKSADSKPTAEDLTTHVSDDFVKSSPKPDSSRTAIVLGAGAVGVCTALMLQQKGWHVTLIDRSPPGSETSGGNAGILSSSPAPFNSPSLWRQLPSLLSGDYGVRLDLSYAATQLPWLMGYFSNATSSSFIRRGRALNNLVEQSLQLHRQWVTERGMNNLLKEDGWLKCYRNSQSFDDTKPDRALWDILGVDYRVLNAAEIPEFTSGARPIFVRAIHLSGSMSVTNPQKLVEGYTEWFSQLGGQVLQSEVKTLARGSDGQWRAHLPDGEHIDASAVVVALGPWSASFLRKLDVRPRIKLPIGFECGGHRSFAAPSDSLAIPIADIDGGYVASMKEGVLRMTSGVYFTHQKNHSPIMLNAAEEKMREAMNNVGAQSGGDWHGARPTTPDCLPLIGPLRAAGLWAATAHQHIGLSAAPASGAMLAEWMSGKPPEYAHYFHPARYNL